MPSRPCAKMTEKEREGCRRRTEAYRQRKYAAARAEAERMLEEPGFEWLKAIPWATDLTADLPEWPNPGRRK
jgi:hypothetical protein